MTVAKREGNTLSSDERSTRAHDRCIKTIRGHLFNASFPALLAATSAVAVAQPAWAQSAQPDSNNVAHDDSGSTDIIVTATRRNEGASKVPISISAFGEAALQVSGVKGIDQIAALTPGVQFDQNSGYGSGTRTNIAIRGINSIYGSSTTGIYYDDTILGSHVTPVTIFGNPYPVAFDLARVEVLRGPQGTLFGAGSEGGTVRLIPNAPSVTEYSGKLVSEMSYTDGGDPSYEIGAALGGPIISDKLGFRMSAYYRRDGGYVDRVSPFPGNALVEENSDWLGTQAYKIALMAKPNDWLTITPSFYLQSSHKNDSGAYFQYLSDPSHGVFKNGRLLRQPATDNLYISALKVEADLGPATLTSISSYVHRKGTSIADLTNPVPALFNGLGYDGNPLPDPLTIESELPLSSSDASPAYVSIKQDVYSEELRLASSDAGARLNWLAGIYYSHSRQSDIYHQFSLPSAILYGAASLDDPTYTQDPTNIVIQISGFGQIDYKLTDRLKASAGVRVGHIKTSQTIVLAGIINTAFGSAGTFQDGAKETPVTPKFALSYQLDRNNLFYVSAGKGFREGGVNPRIPPPPTCPVVRNSYDSDSLWSYEVGAKNALFGGRLHLNASAYHIDWKNIQTVLRFGCGYSTILNAANSVTNGIDIAAHANVGTHWKLSGSVAYNDAHYTKTLNALDINGNATIPFIRKGDVVGAPPQVLSPWNVTASIEYNFKAFGGKDGFVRVENIFRSHNSGPYVTSVNSFLRADGSTNMVNVRGGLSWGNYDMAVFVNNALNSRPILGDYNDGGGLPLTVATSFRPLTVGFSASYTF